MISCLKSTLALAFVLTGACTSSSWIDEVDGKLMLLEIRVNGKTSAVAVWPEEVGSEPDSLWPYLKKEFMARKDVMPKPKMGTTHTLKGKIVLQLKWPSGKTFDKVEIKQLTLTHAKPASAFPDETRWQIGSDEIKRIRKFVDAKR